MKKDEVVKKEIYRSKCGDQTITYSGKPNTDNWARKIKQVLDDLEAGRYDNEK
ncbi:hypothetical protein [Metabacillus litoralis]|uniref:hypothetical protein n=1 Tax=Metabacillus litoralis TaxID=152268 RepID=UPI0020416C13|nr:hypothetical protein [Metabacillus litoralis]MCM3160968.1 hypothetical protein [Metabacillus litoralis]